MSDKNNEVAQSVLLFLVQLGLVCLSGLVTASLWNWFLVPLGLVSINWIHGMGIDIFITYLVHRVLEEDLKDYDLQAKIKKTAIVVGFTLGVWGYGYIVHLMM